MAKVRWPKRWHGRISAVVTILGGLVGLAVMQDFRGGYGDSEAQGSLAVACVTIAGIAVLLTFGRRLDRTHPTSGLFEALVRLLAPTLIVVLTSAWLMNLGIFARDRTAPIGIALFCGATVAACVGLDRTWWSTTPGDPAAPVASAPTNPTPQTGAARTSTPQFDGPPRWPTAPPTEPPIGVPTETPATATSAIESESPDRGSTVHRITSGIITAGWLPLGFIVWFAANWCPDEGTADAVFIVSTVYVIAQLLGNMLAGWFLDRRFGARGGTMLAIGRSVLVALVLMITIGYFLALFVPEGASRYCG